MFGVRCLRISQDDTEQCGAVAPGDSLVCEGAGGGAGTAATRQVREASDLLVQRRGVRLPR